MSLDSLTYYWHTFRYWLASLIVGFDIETEVDAAYGAGRMWGKIEAGTLQKIYDISDES